LFEGEITHRDSLGFTQAIRPGEINWMTAGRGITHSERFERARAEGGDLHGIQAWVALPERDEETEPAFAHYDAASLPRFDAGGVRGRLLAGTAYGERAGVRTHSPMFYVHVELERGAVLEMPDEYPERAVYVALGAVDVAGSRIAAGQMVVFAPGDARMTALEPSTVMLLGGEPLGPRYIEWNFVSSRKERIEQAKADWRAGRMKLPDLDHDEFIPLPDDPPAPASPKS
jgi:redox-sensitive bicupin YhaK (pirin superfamily)